MLSGWFGSKSETPAETPAEGSQPPAEGGGMFSGAFNFMKGVLGMDQLAVADSGDAKKETDPEYENKRKGLFAQLSGLVGKDMISMISLPVWVFEPASFLQIMAEPLQYAELLQKASECTDPLDRLVYVAAFNCALYSTAVRTKKPFNPLLGETLEVVSKDGKFKFLAEQVSHHPPIGVSETISEDYILQLETILGSKFYGNSTDILINGTNHLLLPKTKDDITWGHIVTVCHNIILGSMWIDHHGELDIKNHTTGDKCKLKFQQTGWLGSGRYLVTGEVFDRHGTLRRRLRGKWNEDLRSVKVYEGKDDPNETVVWTVDPPENNGHKWHFANFMADEVIGLTPELEAVLPPTDSRVRADRRALEANDLDTAGKAKHEMEEAQRARKRAREAKGEEWVPKYFEKVDDSTHGHVWKFNGKYWEERKEREEKAKETKPDDTLPEEVEKLAI